MALPSGQVSIFFDRDLLFCAVLYVNHIFSPTPVILRTIESNNVCDLWCFPIVMCVVFCIVSYFGYSFQNIMFVFTTTCPIFTHLKIMALPDGHQLIVCITSNSTGYIISLRLTVWALPVGKVFFYLSQSTVSAWCCT